MLKQSAKDPSHTVRYSRHTQGELAGQWAGSMDAPIDFHRHFSWLRQAKQCSAANHDTYQERLLRLEGDKESLVLQVSILTDQVKAQGEKIRDLESSLEEHRQKLASTEVMLQQDLLHEVKQLKREVEGLQGEKGQYERKLRATKADISELQQLLASKDAEIECLQTQLMARGGTADANTERDQEYQRLKAGMESLLASNGEKERRIEELTSLLGQYRKMREVMALTQGVSDEDLSGSSAVRAFTHKAHSDIVRSQMSSLSSSPFVLSSSPYQRGFDSSIHDSLHTSLLSTGDTSFCNGSWHQRRLLSSSLEELQSGSLQKDPHLELSRYQTLPGKLMMNKREQRARKHGDGEGEEDVSPGHCLQQEHYGLNQPEQLKECVLSGQSPLSSGVDSGQQSPVLPENRKSQRGIRKLWGKIRHSQSGSPAQGHDPELGELKRGGFRATAGPRLARSGNPRDLKMPFCKWSKEQVCDWLEEIGLGQYGVLACHWVTSGDTLLSSTMQDIEKEPAIKNPLHRKKLQLAMKTISSKQPDKSAELDYIWVTRWLDDIGLPQYKDQFSEGRVDGQMLQFLTVNELLFLKVTSQLHHLSLKSAIHVLHVNKFNSNCLKRRPSNQNQLAPSEVVQWSNHRVMEWLRSVDLAEYAPNLRGSGVHGGLLMLEPRFNPETLAMLLNIPPEKTLLRRHLTTNFNNLVGAEAHLEKKVYTEAVGNTPLSITAKVKPKKLGFTNLTHLRRRRPDESKDYVCPIALSLPRSGVPAVNDEVQVQP
ncbi:liprin-beta-2b isoform X2 [Pseudochaenichthys georgianus]|uniref:liprin-beta-2b isoform X2 n=1 Tax=Pseudochaenichthys georgianus TaxID=52239 RepID=UPI0039C44E07